MSDNYPNPQRSPNKRFSEILSEGFRLFGKNWLTLIIPFGLLFIVSIVLKNLILVDLEWELVTLTPAIETILEGDPYSITPEDFDMLIRYLIVGFSAIFLDGLFPTVFNVISMCLVSNYLYSKFIGKDTKLITEIKKALNWRILLVILLLGVGFSVGFLLLFIPGILLFVFFIFYIFTYYSDDSKRPLKDARNLAKGEFWKIVATFFFYNLIIYLFDSIYYMIISNFVEINPFWYYPSTRDYGAIILYDFILNLVPFLLTPLLVCLLTSMYANLKKRKEQYLESQTSYEETPQSDDIPQKEIISGPGIFCPFCGKAMRVKFQFCMHCGENLDFEIQE